MHIMELIDFGDHGGPSSQWLRPWCYGSCIVSCYYLTMMT